MNFLERLFLGVLGLGETGVLVILAVLFLRCVLHRMPKKFSYVLWAIPAVRLLIPVSFHGIIELPKRAVSFGPLPALPPVTGHANALPDLGNQAAGAAARHVPVPPAEPEKPVLLLILACVWLAGMLLIAAKSGYDYYRLQKKLRICVEWKDHIYLADGIAQPFVMAGFPCRIYVPSQLSEKERRYILLHEQVHVKRGDAFFTLLAAVIRCVHWFNPAVWLGVRMFNRDMEMSCDEAAAKGLDAAEKKAYALELLQFSVRRRRGQRLPCAFGEKGVKGRIVNLSKEKRTSGMAFVLAGAVVVLAAVLLVPNFQGAAYGVAKGNDAVAREGIGDDMSKADEGIHPAPGQELPEKPADDAGAAGQKAEDDDGIREEAITLNGVPVSMRWQAEEFSAEEMEAVARVAYRAFAGTYLSGERRPEQMYSLDGMAYDFETADDLNRIFSDTESPMIWRLSVTLPDNWREDKGMGMMKNEESQKQEYDIALAKNAAGEWELADSVWRVYYDSEGNFRWTE